MEKKGFSQRPSCFVVLLFAATLPVLAQPPEPAAEAVGSRYLEVTPQPWPTDVAIRILGQSCDQDHPSSCGDCTEAACVDAFVQADGTLGDVPVVRSAAAWGTVFVTGADIFPEALYRVLIEDASGPGGSRIVKTFKFGDTNGDFVVDDTDRLCVLDVLGGGIEGLCSLQAADVSGAERCDPPDGLATVVDLVAILDAIQGVVPCTGLACPPSPPRDPTRASWMPTLAPLSPAESCLVNEDFEGSAGGWVNHGASTCTTGRYVVGNPTEQASAGVTTQVGGAFSGTNALFTAFNTSVGRDDVDNGECVLASPLFEVMEDSTLSLMYFHGQRDAGDHPTGDFFLLEYTLDGGSSWHPLASNGDAASNAVWTHGTAPIPAGSDVQIQVRCADGAGIGDLVECGIDDVSICFD